MKFQSEVDFGLVVLIWMVQLIIYPAYHFFEEANLLKWHPVYSSMITVIVMPLMLGQVALHGLHLLKAPSLTGGIQAAMIAAIWALTFFKAVPEHTAIQAGKDMSTHITALVNWNWGRTVLWSLIFLLDLLPQTQTGASITKSTLSG